MSEEELKPLSESEIVKLQRAHIAFDYDRLRVTIDVLRAENEALRKRAEEAEREIHMFDRRIDHKPLADVD